MLLNSPKINHERYLSESSVEIEKHVKDEKIFETKVHLPKLITESLMSPNFYQIMRERYIYSFSETKDDDLLISPKSHNNNNNSNLITIASTKNDHKKNVFSDESIPSTRKIELLKSYPRGLTMVSSETSLDKDKEIGIKSSYNHLPLSKISRGNKRSNFSNYINYFDPPNEYELFKSKINNKMSSINIKRKRPNALSPIINNKINNLINIHYHYRDIVNKKEFKNLNFNMNEINSKKDYLKTVVQKSFINIISKNNNLNDEPSNDLTSEFKEKNVKFNISITSIILRFYLSNGNALKYEYKLPLKYIPFFYYRGIDFFKILLSRIVQFKEETFTDIKINFNKLIPFLKKRLSILPIIDNDKTQNNNNINNNNNLKNLVNLSNKIQIKKLSINPALNNFSYNVGLDNEKLIGNLFEDEELFEESPMSDSKRFDIYPVNSNSLNKRIEKNIKNDNFYNIYEFVWVTPSKTYRVEVSLPYCTLENQKNGVSLKKYLEYNLLFYLYDKNFENWDYYIINYLLNFKMCRNIIDRLCSKFNKIMNTQLDLLPIKRLSYVSQDTYLSYIITNEDYVNYIGQISSSKFKINISKPVGNNTFDDDYSNDYIINFNFSQMKKLIIASKFFGKEKLKDMLMKFTNYDRNTNRLTFEYDKIDNINEDNWENFLNDIVKYSYGNCTNDVNDNFNFASYSNNKFHYTKKLTIRNLKKKYTVKKIYHGKTRAEFVYPYSKILDFKDNGDIMQLSKESILDKMKEFVEDDLINLPGFIYNYNKNKGKVSRNDIVKNIKNIKFHKKNSKHKSVKLINSHKIENENSIDDNNSNQDDNNSNNNEDNSNKNIIDDNNKNK